MLAADARTAISCAEAGAYDLILLDIQLAAPGSSGLDVVRHVRALPGPGARARIFALTGDGLDDQHARYREAGLDGKLLKPLALDRGLAAALRDAAWPMFPAKSRMPQKNA